MDGKAARADLAPKPVELPTTSLKLSKEFERFIRGPPAGVPANPGETKKEGDASASGLPRRKAGKLVFGAGGWVARPRGGEGQGAGEEGGEEDRRPSSPRSGIGERSGRGAR